MTKDQAKHDFINNSIRIDVLHKMICEAIEEDKTINKEYMKDLEKFLIEQIQNLKSL